MRAFTFLKEVHRRESSKILADLVAVLALPARVMLAWFEVRLCVSVYSLISCHIVFKLVLYLLVLQVIVPYAAPNCPTQLLPQ